jgi:vacuolar-type H+-ATPase subunit I/STV1
MNMDVSQRLSFFAALFRVDDQPETGMWLLYITTIVLSIIVYKLGFAKKLRIAQSILIYIFLILGCTILTFFGVFLPVAEGLVVAALILIIYKIRLRNSKKIEASANSSEGKL